MPVLAESDPCLTNCALNAMPLHYSLNKNLASGFNLMKADIN